MHAIRHLPSAAPFAAMLAALLTAMSALPAYAQSATTAPTTAKDGRIAPRYFDVVNASHDSVEAIAIAPAGSNTFEQIEIGDPLRGGVTAITLDVPAGGCLRDVRVTFRGERALLYPAIDLCRARGLRLSPRDARQQAPGERLVTRTPADPD
jgi:hypothetical protein